MRWPTRPVLVWKGTAALRIVSPSLSAGGPKTRSLLSAADNAWRLDRPNRPQTDHRNLNLQKSIKNGTALESTHMTERCAIRNDLKIHSFKTTKSHAFSSILEVIPCRLVVIDVLIDGSAFILRVKSTRHNISDNVTFQQLPLITPDLASPMLLTYCSMGSQLSNSVPISNRFYPDMQHVT